MTETEIRIIADGNGFLHALLPDGKTKTILVDVPGVSHYGLLTIGGEIDGEVEYVLEARK